MLLACSRCPILIEKEKKKGGGGVQCRAMAGNKVKSCTRGLKDGAC